jgi:AraC-like DNA-binding protein
VNGLAALARYLSLNSVDKSLPLAGSGIPTSDLDDPDFLVTPEQEIKVIRNFIKLVPVPGIGLIIGRLYHVGLLGMLGTAAINSNTVLDAIKMLFRFDDLLLTFFCYELKVRDNLAFIKIEELMDLQDVRHFVCEREFASIYRMYQDFIGEPAQPKELHLALPKPSYASNYQEIVQCPIIFNAEHHLIVFDKSYLFKPLPMANPLARKKYEKECVQLSMRMKRQGTISKRIRQEILFHKDGYPDFNQLARHMNIAPWTLKRRLSAEGTTYKKIESDLRKKKAIDLLKTTDYPVEQIATEVGFNDISNFYRAFKRWTGRNPGNYRKKSL